MPHRDSEIILSPQIFGRVTLFGEHLIKCGGAGGSLPISRSVWYGKLPDVSWYDPTRDAARRAVETLGVGIRAGVHGDLPLGYGFAGSAALAALHVANLPGIGVSGFMRATEATVHGMSPSGFDIAAILRGAPGTFLGGRWANVPLPSRLTIIAAGFAPPRYPIDYTVVKARLSLSARELVAISHDLACSLRSGDLDEELMHRYCTVLHGRGVYRGQAAALIGGALAEGLIAKGTGGLRNKAVIIIAQTARCVRLATKLVEKSSPDWHFIAVSGPTTPSRTVEGNDHERCDAETYVGLNA